MRNDSQVILWILITIAFSYSSLLGQNDMGIVVLKSDLIEFENPVDFKIIPEGGDTIYLRRINEERFEVDLNSIRSYNSMDFTRLGVEVTDCRYRYEFTIPKVTLIRCPITDISLERTKRHLYHYIIVDCGGVIQTGILNRSKL